MNTERERLEAYLLCSIPGIGAVSIRKLLREAGSVQAVEKLPKERLQALLGQARAERLYRGMEQARIRSAEEKYYRMRERGIFFLPLWDRDYPARLREVADAPVALYGLGKLPDSGQKAAAVIGTRECSHYGREMARYFAGGFAKAGVTVVSGMARGVDSAAGRAALEAGGCSAAVLGCGVDICYPPENRTLYEALKKEGCLLSEYAPGTLPESRLFPPRNRIISGLSDLVLVTEARKKSGTLITVDMALEQGRDVYAVPGRITDDCSRGCNRLIANGAGAALNVRQLLRELGIEEDIEPAQDGAGAQDGQRSDGDTLAERLLCLLDCTPKSLDEILEGLAGDKTGIVPPQNRLLEELMLLCMEGKAESSGGYYFLKWKEQIL